MYSNNIIFTNQNTSIFYSSSCDDRYSIDSDLTFVYKKSNKYSNHLNCVQVIYSYYQLLI